jgi:hypothetical protein
VEDAVIRNARVREGTTVFLEVSGERSQGIVLHGNDLRRARIPYRVKPQARKSAVHMGNNVVSGK